MMEMSVEEFGPWLKLFAHDIANKPVPETLNKCKPIINQGVRDNFTSSADPDDIDWPPRRPNPNDDGHPILIDKGDLLQAATGGGHGHISENTGRELSQGVDGSAVPYAAIHNFGGTKMPKREYMGVDDEKVDEIADSIADNVVPELLGE